MESAGGKPYSYNAAFSYGGATFDVNMTRFSFSWAMAEKGRAQTRMSYTVYPYRVEQSKLTVELVFRDVPEYLRFWRFVEAYQRGAVSSGSHYMRFKSAVIQKSKGGCDYGVALESVPFAVRHTDVAPKMTLTMFIMRDNFDYESVSLSTRKGSEKTLVDKKVTASTVKSNGEMTFAEPTEKKIREKAVKKAIEQTAIDGDCANLAVAEKISFSKSPTAV